MLPKDTQIVFDLNFRNNSLEIALDEAKVGWLGHLYSDSSLILDRLLGCIGEHRSKLYLGPRVYVFNAPPGLTWRAHVSVIFGSGQRA